MAAGGALSNHLTPVGLAAAARLVRTGVRHTQPSEDRGGIDVPKSAEHHMTMLPDVDIGSGSVRFAKDYIGVDYHNDGHSHIDAFATWPTTAFFDGKPARSITADGAQTVHRCPQERVVGRGVLLDVPRMRGVPWVEPGEHVFREDLEAAERDQGVRVGAGDILLVRTGHARRLAELDPWDTSKAKAGLHPTAATFLADRRWPHSGRTATTTPLRAPRRGSASRYTSWRSTRWASTCSTTSSSRSRAACEPGRWEFLFVAAPLRIVAGRDRRSTPSRSSERSG